MKTVAFNAVVSLTPEQVTQYQLEWKRSVAKIEVLRMAQNVQEVASIMLPLVYLCNVNTLDGVRFIKCIRLAVSTLYHRNKQSAGLFPANTYTDLWEELEDLEMELLKEKAFTREDRFETYVQRLHIGVGKSLDMACCILSNAKLEERHSPAHLSLARLIASEWRKPLIAILY